MEADNNHLSSRSEESARTAEDWGLIPESGRSPGEGSGNPPQHSCLDTRASQSTVHGVTKSRTGLSEEHFHFQVNLNKRPEQRCLGESAQLAPWSLSPWSHHGDFSTPIYPLYEKEQVFTSLKLSDHLRLGVNGGQGEEGSWFSKGK